VETRRRSSTRRFQRSHRVASTPSFPPTHKNTRAQLALPYWQENTSARWKLAGVVGLTLATTGVRCGAL
jgi:hypothetical protein